MKAKEVAAELMKMPDAEVLLKVGSDWVEVCGVSKFADANAVTLNVENPALGGGVIVVDPDMTPLNQADE